jgi:hypothetical protein
MMDTPKFFVLAKFIRHLEAAMNWSTLTAVAVSAAPAARTAFCIDAPSTATPSAVAPVFDASMMRSRP